MTLALSQDNTESLEHSPISNGTATPLVPIPVSGHSMWPTLHPDDILWTRLAPTQLRPGDIALFRRGDELFSHRFLGFRHHDQQRFLLAKGDGSWAFDPLWPEQTLFGVAESIERNAVSHPLTTISAWRRWLAVGLGLLKGAIYHMKYRFFAILLILILLTSVTEASVTLTTFTATFQGNGVLLHWETASEVNALGFNLYRSLLPAGEEVLLNPDIILAQGGITGGTYDFSDENPPVADGYQYRLEEIDANGQIESFTPVVLSRITATPTATPSATLTSPTNTPTASPEPTNTPTTTASFTTTPTPTASSSPALTPATSPTPTPITSPTLSASPTPVFTSTPAPTPTATPIPPTATALPALTPNPTPTSTSIAAPATTATPTASPAAIAAIPAATPVPLRFPAAGNSSSPSAARNPNLVYGLVGILSLLGAAILVVILIHLRGGWRR